MGLHVEFCDLDHEGHAGSILASYPVSEELFDYFIGIVQDTLKLVKYSDEDEA